VGTEENIWLDVIRGWRKLYNEEPYNLFPTLDLCCLYAEIKIREWHVACMKRRNARKIFVEKPEGEGPLGIFSCRRVNTELT
jgi:hypothetical protein